MPGKKKLTLRVKRFHPGNLFLKKIKTINRKKLIRKTLLAAFFFSILLCGAGLGVYKAILQNLPDIAQLEEFEPGIITYIYADDGSIIGEYALQKRIEVSYEEIPEVLKQAIIATEDPRFYKHRGIDFLGILRAVKEDIKLIFSPRRLHGGSTISQQLIRELLLHRRQEVRRKLKEAILALQVERKYTKKEILTMYCNQFYLNHGAYGVEAASQLYFGKRVSEISLAEAAMITGIFRGPSVYSPYNTPERTLRRRNHVINRMVEEGFITKEEGETVKKEPLNVLPLRRGESEFSAYFNEEVRKYLEKTYGADTLYRGGLRVYTTLNPDYQRYAEEALIKGLKVLDKRQGWRKDKVNLLEKGIENLEELEKPFKDKASDRILLATWNSSGLERGKNVEAIVLAVDSNRASLKIRDYTGTLTNRDIGWTKTKNLKSLIRRGDVILVSIKSVDGEKKILEASLDQEPNLEGAFVAIHPQTGQIKAMVGGYSFNRLKFNQATQALRQAGSSIKPILYTAALENNYTPATAFVDEPTKFQDQWSDELWEPPNYDLKYKGRVTLRTGLEESRNIVTAKLLEYISPQTGVDYCQRFGLTTPVYPYLSLALGTFEVRLIEMVSAFSTFPNKGVRVPPHFITRIEDKDGNILEETRVESEDVISPQIAYIMTSLMQGVILRGTGAAASGLAMEKALAGKTGTTDDYSDAWFIGFSPSLCAGVWVGHETLIPIGERQSGAVAALPIWMDFFKSVIEEEKSAATERGEEYKREDFVVPPNLSFRRIDRKTGLLASPICLWTIEEVFLPGTEPDRYCTYEDHMMRLDYYNTLRKKDED